MTVIAENRADRVMTIDNRPPEIPTVCSEQIAIALALFRGAVLDETAQEAILPLSDRGLWKALLEPQTLLRGIGVIRIHFESSDGVHPVVQRVVCFLQLLREQNQNPHPLWNDIVTHHNRFIPIINAIAWCAAYRDKAFDVVPFAKIASYVTNDVNGYLSHVN
jgi:hypothetical protein